MRLTLGLNLLRKALSAAGLIAPGEMGLLLEDDASFVLLEDDASVLLLE